MEIEHEGKKIKVMDKKQFSGLHVTKIDNGYIVTLWAVDNGQARDKPEEEKYYFPTEKKVQAFRVALATDDKIKIE